MDYVFMIGFGAGTLITAAAFITALWLLSKEPKQ